MEILRSWGLEQEVLDRSEPTQLAMAVRPVLAAPGSEISLGLPTEEVLAALTPSRFAVFPQDELEALLLAEVQPRGGEVRFGTELVGLQAGRVRGDGRPSRSGGTGRPIAGHGALPGRRRRRHAARSARSLGIRVRRAGLGG